MVDLAQAESEFCLAPLIAEDLPTLARLVSDPEVCSGLGIPEAARSRTFVDDYLALRLQDVDQGRSLQFSIKQGPRVQGATALLDIAPNATRAELCFWLGRPYWGRGLASVAVHRVLGIVASKRLVRRLEAQCRDDNLGAHRVLEKNGFWPYRHPYLSGLHFQRDMKVPRSLTPA